MRSRDLILWAAAGAICLQTLAVYFYVTTTHGSLETEPEFALPVQSKANNNNKWKQKQCPPPLHPVDRTNPYYVVNGSPLWRPKSTSGKPKSLLIVSCMIQDPRALVAIASQLQCWARAFDEVVLIFPEYGRAIVEPFLRQWKESVKEADFANTVISRYYLVTSRYEMGIWCDVLELYEDRMPEHVVLATDCLLSVSTEPVMESMLSNVESGAYDLVGLTIHQDSSGARLDPFVYAVSIQAWEKKIRPRICRIATDDIWGYQYPEDYIRVPFFRENFQQSIQSLFEPTRVLALYLSPNEIPAPHAPTADDMKYNAKKPDRDFVRKVAMWKDDDWMKKVASDDEKFPVGKTFAQIPESLAFEANDASKRAILSTCLGGTAAKLDETLNWAKSSFAGKEVGLGVSVC